MAETRSSSVELATFGDGAELDRLAVELHRIFGIRPAEPPSPAAGLPDGWVELAAPEGGTVLAKSPRGRRQAAWFFAGVAALLAVAGVLVGGDVRDPGAIRMAAVLLLIGLAAGLLAAWIGASRKEWKLEPGRLRLQRRLGSRVKPLFDGRRLEFTWSTDGDGDSWYELAVCAGEPKAKGESKSRERRVVLRRINDPWEVRRVGRWIAHRVGVPLHEG